MVLFKGTLMSNATDRWPAGITTVPGGNSCVGESLITITATAAFVGVLCVR